MIRPRSLSRLVAPALVFIAGCASSAPPRLAWTPPTEVRLSSAQSTEVVDGEQEIEVREGDEVWLEARPGDRLRVSGALRLEDLQFGVSGPRVSTESGGKTTAITWLGAEAVPGGIGFQVPHWTSAGTVVIRSKVAARLRVAMAEPEVSLLGWERFEEDAIDWVRGARDEVPSAPSAAMEPSVRFIAAMRDALGERAKSEAGRALLSLALVQEGWVQRPLTSLVFPWASVAVTGGSEARLKETGGVLERQDRTVWRNVSAGESISVSAPGADIVRLRVFGGKSASRIVVSAGGVVVRTLLVPSASRRSLRPISLRLVVPESGEVNVKVDAGDATIGALAHAHRPSLAEKLLFHHRDPRALAQIASKEEVAGVLARALRARDAEAFRSLEAAAAKASDAGTRALLLAISADLAPSVKDVVRVAQEGFRATEGLTAQVAWPIRRRITEALLDRRARMIAEFPKGPGIAMPTNWKGADIDDRVAVRVALSVLNRAAGPTRPEAAALATRLALLDSGRDDWASRARLAWQTEVGWLPLKVSGAPDVRLAWAVPLPDPGAPSAMCEASVVGIPRWTRLEPGTTRIRVVVPPGETHSVVHLRSEEPQSLPPGAVEIDGTKVPVHTAIGMPSIVALAAGEHDFTLPKEAGPVLARIGRDDKILPCNELRRMDRWFFANGEVSVDVPPGTVETVLRVSVRPAESRGPIRLDVAGVRSDILNLGEDGIAVEAPVLTTKGAVPIVPSAPVWMRVEVRGRMDRERAPQIALSTVPDEATLLARVRAKTRALAAAKTDDARRAELRARADALVSLGFRRLALVDVGLSKWTAEGLLDVVDPDSEPDEEILAKRLPNGAPSIVPLNTPARIEELAPPADAKALAPVIERVDGGDPAGAAARIAEVPEASTPDEGTLLRALVTERTGVWEPASKAYGRIALEADRPVAAVRAALAYADLALVTGDPDKALIGYLFAKRAEKAGADARAAMGRLDPAIGFVRPDTAATAGHTWVEREGQPARVVLSLAERVRRAYLDAPDDALVLTSDERLVMHLTPKKKTTVVVEHVCALLDGAPPPGAACRVEVEVDGAPQECASSSRGRATAAGMTKATGITAHGAIASGASYPSCTLSVPAGKHRVDVALTGSVERMGWVRARIESGLPIVPRSAARWLETDARRPLKLGFAGPTLVRIDARGRPEEKDRLEVLIDGEKVETLDLNTDTDQTAFRRDLSEDVDRAVRAEQQIEIIVAKAGAHSLEIRSRGRALVRPSFAVARGLPRPTAKPRIVGVSVFGDPIAPFSSPAPEVGEDAVPGSFTLSAQATLVLDQAQEFRLPANNAGRYLEARIVARKRWFDGRLFGRLAGLVRGRTGASTFGAEGRLDFNSPIGSPVPRVFLDGAIYAQENDSLAAAVWGRAGLWWQAQPKPGLNIVPTIGAEVNSASRAEVERFADLARLDPDVFVRYDAVRAFALFGSVMGSYRPAMDTIVRLRLGAHTLGVEGMRDVYASPSIDFAPGRGLAPQLSLGYTFAYSFASVSVSEPFVSHRVDLTAFLWSWVRASHRVSATATTLVQAGSAFGDDPDLRLIFGLAYDFTAGRGMSDFGPLEMQFRERFDENGGRVLRRIPQTGEGPVEPEVAP